MAPNAKKVNATPAPAATTVAATPAPVAAAKASTSTKKEKATKPEEVKVAVAPATPAPAVVAPVAAAPKAKATKSASTKSEATPAPAAEPVAAAATTETTSEEENKGERRKPTKDTINAEFEKLKKWFEDKICVLCPPKEEGDAAAAATDANGKKKRKRANKGLGIKDVRFLKKTIEQIQKDHIKVAKIKNNNRKNLTSGLKKEVLLSDELYDFCGFAKGSLHSRVEVNTQLNKYVKERNLQDKEDGRLIHPDAKLKALLRLDAGYAGPIKFWELTQKTACHFINTNAAAAPVKA
jgi:chromatin remodeling complex protein RSC6